MAMGVRRLDHHGLLARGTRMLDQVCRSCSCRCMQEEIPVLLPTGAKRAPRHAGREKCVYGLLRHYSRSGVSRDAIMLAVRGKTHFCNARSRNSEAHFNLFSRHERTFIPLGEFMADAAPGK